MALLAMCCVLNINSIVVDYLAIAAFVCFLVVTLCSNYKLALKYLWFYVIAAWAILAVMILENGDVSLRGMHSTHFGSLPIFVLSWLVFFATIFLLEKRRNIRVKHFDLHKRERGRNLDLLAKCIYYIGLFILMLCIAIVLPNSSITQRVDRFGYAANGLPDFVASCMPLFYPLVPVSMVLGKRSLVYPAVYLLCFILLSVLIGEKFSGLFVGACFVGIAIYGIWDQFDFGKMFKGICLVGVLLLIVVWLHETMLGTVDFWAYLSERVAAQGELWWLVYGKHDLIPATISDFNDEIDALLFKQGELMASYDFGIYKLMKLFMSQAWVETALSQGIRATESTRADFYFYGGSGLLCIGQLLLGCVTYCLVNACVNACKRRDVIKILLVFYLLRVYITAFAMSDFYILFSLRMFVAYGLLLVIWVRDLHGDYDCKQARQYHTWRTSDGLWPLLKQLGNRG